MELTRDKNGHILLAKFDLFIQLLIILSLVAFALGTLPQLSQENRKLLQYFEIFTSVFHSFWWAVCTLTTVGYGDIYPITVGGKIFTFVVLMIGLGFVAVPTGLIASALSTARSEEES